MHYCLLRCVTRMLQSSTTVNLACLNTPLFCLTTGVLTCRPWGQHTSFTNRAGNVVRQIRQQQGEVELCTTAWAKMYESIVTFDLLPATGVALGHLENGQPAMGTVHLCEAPGAFITATNHFIRTQRYAFCSCFYPKCSAYCVFATCLYTLSLYTPCLLAPPT